MNEHRPRQGVEVRESPLTPLLPSLEIDKRIIQASYSLAPAC